AVAGNDPDVRAQPTEAGRSDLQRVAAPGVEEDPPPVRLDDRDLVRALEAAGEADLLGAVERRAMDLDLPVAVLVPRGRVLPDDVGVVEPGDRLSEQHRGGVDDEPASRPGRVVGG